MEKDRLCVVLIEDHPLVREGQRMLLEAVGYEVVEIAKVEDLSRLAATASGVHAIIADFDLGPGMTGVDAALEVMRYAGTHIPTLLMSASFGNRSKPAAAKHGMSLVFKPADVGKVLEWVAEAVNGQGHGPNPGGTDQTILRSRV